MNITAVFGVLVLVASISAGQILFKLAALSLPTLGKVTLVDLAALLSNPCFILAIALYAGTTVLWVWVLREADLSRVYPFVSLSFVLVPAAGVVFFGEKATLGLVIGIALILAGVFIIARYA